MNIHLGFAVAIPVPVRDTLYSDIHDRQKHVSVIHAIAEELARPVDEITERYEEILGELRESARIPDYLPLFVAKRVKQFYRQH